MAFKDWTPERRAQAQAKRAETLRKRKETALGGLSETPVPLREPDEYIPAATEPDDFDGVLTPEEIREIEAKARTDVLAEQKAARKKAYMSEARDRARRALNAMPEDEERQKWLDELVDIHIHLPRLRQHGGGDIAADPIILDQKMFRSGRTYSVTRAQGMTLMEIVGHRWRHQEQVEGSSRTYFNHELGQVVHQGGVARGGMMQSGPTFAGVNRRA